MKKCLISTCILLSMVVNLSGCSSAVSDSSESAGTSDIVSTENTTELSDGTFGDTVIGVAPTMPMPNYADLSHLQIMTEIVDVCYANEHTNIMMSPLSLDIALAMIANGADDVTREAYDVYFSDKLSDVNKFYKNYLVTIPANVSIANGLFVNDIHTVKDFMKSVLKEYYNGGLYSLDFSDSSSVDFINKWCSDATNGMIPKVVDNVSSSDALVANALYFKDDWKKEITNVLEDYVFTNAENEQEMSNMLSFRTNTYFESNYATGFCYDYSTDGYGFIAILPKDEGDFNVAELDLDDFMNNSTTEYVVDAMMPEFTFSNNLALTDILTAMGFDEFINGVYTNLIDDDDLMISDVLQYTKVDVNRTGTEAAAVTIIDMKTTAAGHEPEIKTVHCDRPFAFMIYDFNNDMPLFVGKVVSIE